MLYNIAKCICWIIFKLIFRLKVTGQEDIPQDGPFIIVANHSSLLDPVILGISVRPKVIFIAAAYLFKIGWLGYMLRQLNSIPVQRENDIKAIKQSLKILKRGGVLGIFPEGGIDRQKNNLPVRAGAAYLATKIGVPIVPIRIKGADKALPRGAKFIRSLHKIEVEIKKPIYCSRQTNKDKEIIKRVVESYIKEIY
ncbi:1-acyl-sn-glycerol-3-phosphate acyltransferase [bacterium]|nr:1-acyl-sn-glycerol-3-phosphate acyltransferase [bacterium]MBU4361579.1 1-acyl-sn-glycerol-3-phosphate acyltransferase [bacterium]MBU4602596.1 1-acyl-sn-glycerol-3-phosphate acyltransferase [bacterium]